MAMAMAAPPPPPSFAPDDDEDDENNLASLMPNFFSRISDDTCCALDFQDIHRLLSQQTSKDVIEEVLTSKEGSGTNQPLTTYCKRKEKSFETKALDKSSPLARRDYPGGKENVLSSKLPRRHGLLRREGTGRTTSHRRFKVDLRSFGSILNKGASGDSQIPQNVHAFWEAEDEREASEAIMRKVRGEDEPCSQQSMNGNIRLRRSRVRRKGCERRTTSRPFNPELPSYVKRAQSLDEEQLEEEEDDGPESCTFVKKSEVSLEQDFNANQSLVMPAQQTSQLTNLQSIHSNRTRLEVLPPDEAGKVTKKVCDDLHDDGDIQMVISEGESPENGKLTCQQTANISFQKGSLEGPNGEAAVLQDPDNVEIILQDQNAVPGSSTAANRQENLAEDEAEVILEDAMKMTPYDATHNKVVIKGTPMTSPTPPSNPLAALGFRKDNFPDSIGKRKLDFDSTLDSPMPEPAMEVFPIDTEGKQSASLQDSAESIVEINEERTLECRKEMKSVSFGVIKATGTPKQQHIQPRKLQNKNFAKRKTALKHRNSLKGSGTVWDGGVRRSTRIKSRPLDYWRGERFLYGRVHQTLTTVIGIKYSSPLPCWPKRGSERPNFKVESFVSEEYADYVRFAALC